MSDWEVVNDNDWTVEALSPKKESFKKNIMRYGIKDPIAGLANFGNQLINIPSNLAELVGSDKLSERLGVRKGYNYSKALGLPENKNIADIGIQMLPELLGAFAIPEANLGRIGSGLQQIPKVGKYIKSVASQAIPQSIYAGALSSPENAGESALSAGATMTPFAVASEFAKSTSPWARRAAQGIGAIGGYELGKNATQAVGVSPQFADLSGIILGALGARGMTTPRMMQQRLTEGMNPELVNERLEAARRLGLEYLTPAEASLNPFLGSRQGALANTSEGSQLMYQKAKNRVSSEEKSINDLMKTIYNDKKMLPEMERLYEESKKTILPETFINKFKNNEIIKQAEKDVLSSAAYRERAKNIPKESIEYWDLIKQSIGDLEQKAPKGEARIFKEERKNLTKSIDKYDDRYKGARAFAERKKVRDNLLKAFDKADPSAKSFYKAIASKEKFDKLIHNLRNVPEAQQRLKDMRLLFGDLISPPTIRGAAALEKTSMNKPRSSIQAVTDAMENALTKGKYDKEMIDFITSPNWDVIMKDLNKISDKQKRTAAFVEALGKTATVSQSQTREKY